MRSGHLGRKGVRIAVGAVVGASVLSGVLLSTTVFAGATPHASSSAPGIYLTSTGPSFSGPSTGHAGAIDIESFSWGATNDAKVGSSTSGSGKAQGHALTVQFLDNQVTPSFLSALGTGSKFTKLDLTISTDSNDLIYDSEVFELSNARVSSLAYSGAAGEGQLPSVSVSFVYTAVNDTFTPLNSEGLPGSPIVTNWDFATNAA